MSVEVMSGGGSANLQSKSVLPSSLPYTARPDSGYDGFSSFTVQKDSNLIPENVVSGKTIYGVAGTARTPVTAIYTGEGTGGNSLRVFQAIGKIVELKGCYGIVLLAIESNKVASKPTQAGMIFSHIAEGGVTITKDTVQTPYGSTTWLSNTNVFDVSLGYGIGFKFTGTALNTLEVSSSLFSFESGKMYCVYAYGYS